MIVIRVKEAAILKVEDEQKYVFRHDGKNTELTATEAYKFYHTLEGALSSETMCSLDEFVTVTTPGGHGIFFEISREQAWAMWVELRKENKTGKGYWCNQKQR